MSEVANLIIQRLTGAAGRASLTAASDQKLLAEALRIHSLFVNHSQVSSFLRRLGLLPRAVELAGSGRMFDVREVDEALSKAEPHIGRIGVGIKIGLQQMGLLPVA